jgi:hypothetical protein
VANIIGYNQIEQQRYALGKGFLKQYNNFTSKLESISYQTIKVHCFKQCAIKSTL